MENLNYEARGHRFISGTYEGHDVIIVQANGFINATKICAQFGKKYGNWYQATKSKRSIAKITNGGNPRPTIEIEGGIFLPIRGTYVDPRIVVNILEWLNNPNQLAPEVEIRDALAATLPGAVCEVPTPIGRIDILNRY
jgi:hypothetical protein